MGFAMGEEMICFVVMEKNKDGQWRGLGSHEFRIAPRTGEYVTLGDEKGIGQAYRVLAVIHPLEPVPDCAGDLILQHVGTDIEIRKDL